jgi:hypothetical protein
LGLKRKGGKIVYDCVQARQASPVQELTQPHQWMYSTYLAGLKTIVLNCKVISNTQKK